jgi:hypothetical protein
MTLILRSHLTLCSEKTRINKAVRGRVNRSKNDISDLKSWGLEKIMKIEAAHIQA